MMFSRRDIDAAAVGVLAGLDGDAVVAGVEEAILDEHVAASIRDRSRRCSGRGWKC